MPPAAVAGLLFLAAYLVGAIPFGYLVGRLRGVNLLAAGSGNIGATNAARVLGRPFGVFVFILDFLKGAVPVAAIEPVARAADRDLPAALDVSDALRVGAAAFAFVGHLFPVYLGFRGGKGVATGAGVVFVLVPGPAAIAAAAWGLTALTTRFVSLASVAAAAGLLLGRFAMTPDSLGPSAWMLTGFLVVGVGLVVVKHLGNLRRLLAGTENRIGDGHMRQSLLRAVHVLALGTWFGAAAFFNFLAAPAIFASFEQVVNEGPSDRTAYQTIIPPQAPAADRQRLASALAGSAVGPVFPRYFLVQSVCGVAALATALTWWNAGGAVHRWRIFMIGLAVLLVGTGWPVADHVSRLRRERFHPEHAVASAAREAFGRWHLVGLTSSAVTTLLAGVGLALAGKMPTEPIKGRGAAAE